MKKLMTYLFACFAMLTSQVMAEESPHEFSANVDLTTDYIFRGQSQTGNLPTVDGGLDYAHESGFYAGTWASGINFGGNLEIDFYGGYGGELGGTGLGYDVGVLYYYYPGQASGADLDYIEPYLGLSHSFGETVDAGVNFRYSPDWTGSTGDAFNVEGTIDVSLPYGFTLSGLVAHQSVDNNATWGTPDWMYYSAGLSKSIGPFDFGLTYHDTDLSNAECFGGDNLCDGRAVFNISSSW